MFEDQDLQNKKEDNTLNNKVVQKDNQAQTSYQDKLRDNKIAEDIFEDADKIPAVDQKVIKSGNVQDPSISPVQPLTDYQDLVQESQNLKIKPRYFMIGLAVILIIISWFGFWIYKQFFTGTRETGEVILNTESEEINLDSISDENDKIIEEGINVNSSAISNDIDGDGLSNEEEEILGTDLKSSDTDNDGLSDREEVKIYHTDPLNEDSDSDTYLDGEEVENGYNPLGSGKLFDFSLITDESSEEIETTIKELIKPNIDTSDWSSFGTRVFNLSFQYPFDWSINELEDKVVISPLDDQISDYIEIEVRDNIFQLDLVDWLSTQEDYPDFTQDQLKINEDLGLVVNSDNPDWKFISSMFISRGSKVYNFNLFSENDTSDGFNIFQAVVLLTEFGI